MGILKSTAVIQMCSQSWKSLIRSNSLFKDVETEARKGEGTGSVSSKAEVGPGTLASRTGVLLSPHTPCCPGLGMDDWAEG